MIDQSSINPPQNALGPGLTEGLVRTAVDASGYPLQTVVAQEFRKRDWAVEEEWSYLDRDSDELRTIDLRTALRLHGWNPQPRVRPQVNLLIECKQSALPYMFFVSASPVWIPRFPIVVGLREDNIAVISDDDPSTWNFGVVSAMGLDMHAFRTAPPIARAFSKCVRKGPELELSGSDAYSSLILPLVKALHHIENAEEPPNTAYYFDAHLVCAVGVLDAPMIAVDGTVDPPTLTLVPWIRVLRHEYSEEEPHWQREKLWTVDVVHKAFLGRYIDEHLLPFAKEFGQLAVKHQVEIATCEGFVSGMGARRELSIEEHLQPRPITAPLTTSKAVLKNVFRLIPWPGKNR